MIKVLHVLGPVPVGGVGSMLLNFHRHMDAHEIHFDYLMSHSSQSSTFVQEAKNFGGNCYFLPCLKVVNIFSYLIQARCFFKQHAGEYNIVHIHAPNLAFVVGWLAKIYGGINVRIVHSHNTYYSNNWLKSLRNMLLFAPLRLTTTHYCACSEKAGRFLFKNSSFHLVHNGIDISRFAFKADIRARLRAQEGLSDGRVIGCVGNFLAAKNYSFLIRVFHGLLKQNPKVTLVCVGDGPLLPAMKQLAVELKCDQRVRFLGRRADVPDLYNMFDCLAMPSLFEGFPVVGVEAQANGLPCLFSADITSEILLTPQARQLPLDEKIWRAALEQALQMPRSDTHLLIEKAGFSMVHEAQRLTELYKRFLQGNS